MHLLSEASLSGKTVLLRADLDVPLLDGKVCDDTRLLSVIPTVELLLKQDCKVIIAGHLGRPEGVDKSLTLEPIAKWFGIKYKVSSIKWGKRGNFEGWEIGQNIFSPGKFAFFCRRRKKRSRIC